MPALLAECKWDAHLAAAARAAAGVQGRGMPEAEGTSAAEAEEGAPARNFSVAMALRRLHWKNSLLAEVLYLVNIYKVRGPAGPPTPLTPKPSEHTCRMALFFMCKITTETHGLCVMQTGRIHLLPPEKQPFQRPTFFWLF